MEREVYYGTAPSGEEPKNRTENETKIDLDREEVEKEVRGLKREAQDELQAFAQTESDQITPEKTTRLLKTHEAYLRKEVLKEEEAKKNPLASPGDVDYRSEWQRSMDALRGATGDGPVSETVSFLKVEAARYKNEAEVIREKFSGGRLIENRPSAVAGAFEEIADHDQRASRLEKTAANLETAARIFENLESLSSFKVRE